MTGQFQIRLQSQCDCMSFSTMKMKSFCFPPMRQKLKGGVTNQKSHGREAKTHYLHDENITFSESRWGPLWVTFSQKSTLNNTIVVGTIKL